jgi:hypothetical protein
MAHWLLRERMAEHNEDGRPRQEHQRRDPHRPEQNKGYNEAARGGGAGVRPTESGTRRKPKDEFER